MNGKIWLQNWVSGRQKFIRNCKKKINLFSGNINHHEVCSFVIFNRIWCNVIRAGISPIGQRLLQMGMTITFAATAANRGIAFIPPFFFTRKQRTHLYHIIESDLLQ